MSAPLDLGSDAVGIALAETALAMIGPFVLLRPISDSGDPTDPDAITIHATHGGGVETEQGVRAVLLLALSGLDLSDEVETVRALLVNARHQHAQAERDKIHGAHAKDGGCAYCCETCNRDDHRCPGCGAVSDHKNTTCPDCEKL